MEPQPASEAIPKAGLTRGVVVVLRMLADAMQELNPVESPAGAQLARWYADGTLSPAVTAAAMVALVDEGGLSPARLQLLADRYEQALTRPKSWTVVDHN